VLSELEKKDKRFDREKITSETGMGMDGFGHRVDGVFRRKR